MSGSNLNSPRPWGNALPGKKFGVIFGVQNHGDFRPWADLLLSLVWPVKFEWCGAIAGTGYFKTKDPYPDMAQAVWDTSESSSALLNIRQAMHSVSRTLRRRTQDRRVGTTS